MAIVKTVVANSLHRIVFKFVGQGTTTVTLAEMVHATSGFPQSIVGTPRASIVAASASMFDNGNPVTITRNGVDVLVLHGQYIVPEELNSTMKFSENSDQDIVVTHGGNGTSFLTFRKDEGFTLGPNVAGDTR